MKKYEKYGKGLPRYSLGVMIKVVEEALKHGRNFSAEALQLFGVKAGTYLLQMAEPTDALSGID